MNNKTTELVSYLRGLGSAVLALSGGLDSVFLAKALSLSGIRTLAVTSRSETTPAQDLRDAISYAESFGLQHRVITTDEMRRERFVKNSPERCFYCKDTLFGALREIAAAEGYEKVLDGSNASDVGDHRPGMRAAEEHGVLSPLLLYGFYKEDIRALARHMGLAIADKPASPCLSSRFAYGVRITSSGLSRVARAEEFMRSTFGLRDLRVRDMGTHASVEVPPSEVGRITGSRALVVERLKLLGFPSVKIDTEGFRSGRLNDSLGDRG